MVFDRDTIIAPATAVNESGIAILRISGCDALDFLKSYFRTNNNNDEFVSHYLYFGRLFDDENCAIDEVMAVYMAAPRTYTTEHVVEIHCHGSRQIVRKILHLATTSSNIRLAKPGEFTYRAFLNGRIDLVQAEAVSRLIQSTTDFSRQSALQQLDGYLSRKLHAFSSVIRNLLVHIEAWIDFPEEDLPPEDVNKLHSDASDLLSQMTDLKDTYRSGQYVHDGASIVLAGLPNAGKSSLMNALLRQDRSIVSPVPGTTRDLVEQTTQIAGINVRLIDTAGLRDSDDFVEQEGVRRALDVTRKANLILLILDSSSLMSDHFVEIINSLSDCSVVLVLNKSDLFPVQHDLSFFSGPVVNVSAKCGDGIDDLISIVSSHLLHDYQPSAEPSLVTERRHYEALVGASQSLDCFIRNIGSADLDLLSIDLRSALNCLGSITGSVSSADILDDIFSSFCIGK